jgi:Spy/CpxP family protein refolding chaperone
MNTKRFALALALATTPLIAHGQNPPPVAQRVMPAPPPPGSHSPNVVPPFERTLFPPELVMQHQRALALTADQRRIITDALKALQNQTVDLQWNLQAEQSALTELLEQRPIQEQAAVAQITKLMELEAAVKRTHLTALIRIKNSLTDRQVQQLTELRGMRPGGRQPQPASQARDLEQVNRD